MPPHLTTLEKAGVLEAIATWKNPEDDFERSTTYRVPAQVLDARVLEETGT